MRIGIGYVVDGLSTASSRAQTTLHVAEMCEALATLYEMLVSHKDRLPAYRVQAAQVAWKHSIANPVVREEWARVINSV